MGGDVVGALLLLILGCFVAVEAWTLELGTLAQPGAGFFPFWTGVLLAVFSVVLLSSGAARFVEGAYRRSWRDAAKDVYQHKIAICVGALFLYSEILRWIGFSVSTFLLMIVLSKLNPKTSWIGSIAVAVVGTLGFYVTFVRLLSVSFPRGVIGF